MEIEIFRFSNFSPKMIFEKRLREKITLKIGYETLKFIMDANMKLIQKYFIPRKIKIERPTKLFSTLIFTNDSNMFMMFILPLKFSNEEKLKWMVENYLSEFTCENRMS